MKRISLVVLTMTVIVIATLFIACKDGNNEKPVVPVPKLEVPTFVPSIATNFVSTLKVVITPGANAPEGSKIHYTLNGDIPSETASGTTMLYDSAAKITLTETTTGIKAIVIASGMTSSDVATSPVFTKSTQLDAPTFSHTEDTTFEDNLAVSIIPGAGAPEGSKIHYTLNGDDPNEDATGSSSLYDEDNKVSLTETTPVIKAIVISDGLKTSAIATSPFFTKMERLVVPTFTPNTATDFETSQVVTITAGVNAPAGAKIHYTLNGDVPNEAEGGTTMLYDVVNKITLTETTTAIKAIVIADGMLPSNVATSVTFTKVDPVWDGAVGSAPLLNDNVYEVYNPSELAWIAAQSNNFSGKTIKLMDNFNMNSKPFKGIQTFSGTFDGNNKKLMNLIIYQPSVESVGFVWVLNSNGSIKNLTIENGTITGKTNAGGFVGQNTGTAVLEGLVNGADVTAVTIAGGIVGQTPKNVSQMTMQDIENSGTITSDSYAGGVIGYDQGSTTIVNVKNSGNVTSLYAGGIVCYGAATITNAENSGNIEAEGWAGGIYGAAIDVSAILENAKNTGTVKGSDAGGIIGSAQGAQVNKAENFGDITGIGTSETYVGGIMGRSGSNITIANSKNTGSVTSGGNAGSYAGGILGSSSGVSVTISDSFNYAPLFATKKGGMVGKASSGCTINTSYYLNTTTTVVGEGSATSDTSFTSAQFKDQSSFVGWDFSTIWQMGASYPTLK